MDFQVSECPNCGSNRIYIYTTGIAGGGYAANYLPDLGGFLRCAKFYPAVCEDCGLTRFFTDRETRTKLNQSTKWTRLAPES